MESDRVAGLEPDLRMPNLGLLWSKDSLIGLLNQRVSEGLLRGHRVTDASIHHMTYRPGRQCFALCDLEIDAPSGFARQTVVISAAKDERLKLAYERRYAGKRDVRAVHLADLGFLIERYPHDWQIPAAARLLRPQRFRRLFADAGLGEIHEGSIKPRLISYRPHEACVVAYPEIEIAGSTGLVGKAIRESKYIRRFHYASELMRATLEEHPHVWTPRTYRPRGESSVLLMQMASGVSVHDHMDSGSRDERRAATRLAAHGLQEIHRLAPEQIPGTPWGLRSELQHARNRTNRALLAAPVLARQALDVLDQVERLLPRRRTRPVFLHGDYKGSQLLVNEGRIAIIDLDSVKLGDPAIDAGNFLADLRREAVYSDRPELRELDADFLERYLEGNDNPGLIERANLVRIIDLVRMGIHGFRQQAYTYSDAESFKPMALIEEARRCLRAL